MKIMELINKSAVVAEIEKTINSPYPKHDQQCNWEDGYCAGLYKALSIIEDTIEVKEMDLGKIDDWYNNMGIPITADALKETARHFFELGLIARKEK